MKQNEHFFVWKIINILSLRASWNELKMKKLLQCVKNKIYCCFLSNLNLYIFILSPVVYAVFCQSLLCITKKEPEWDINMVLLLFLVIVLSMTHKCAWHIFDLWNMHDYTFFILEKLNCCAKLVTPHTANSVECTAYIKQSQTFKKQISTKQNPEMKWRSINFCNKLNHPFVHSSNCVFILHIPKFTIYRVIFAEFKHFIFYWIIHIHIWNGIHSF